MGSVRHAVTADGHRVGSERPAVIRGIAAFVGVTLSSAGLERFAQLIAMECEDLVPEIVDQFEHGESHLGRPKAGDLDGSRTQMRGAVAPVRS